MDISPSDAPTFWVKFLWKLRRGGLRGVKLVASDAHDGIKTTVAKLMNASWQRCPVHTMHNALGLCGKKEPHGRLGLHGRAFAQDSADAAEASGARSTTSSGPSCPSSRPS
ncbi:MAG: transposase [Roseiarcus sp.]